MSIYYTQLMNGVSPTKVQHTVREILRVLRIDVDGKLPSFTAAQEMKAEIAALCDFDACA